jgi:hypothetical protein
MGRPEYVGDAIESVVAQSFSSWSLVVSENGRPSSRVAAAIKPHLSDPRVRHVEVGGELSAATHHTRMLQSGTASYVAVLHDDDRWHRDFLRDRVGLLEDEGRCAFAFSGARIVDAHGRELTPALPDLPDGVQEPSSFVPRLYGGNMIHVSATVLRRSALLAVDASFREDFPTFDDHELWFRLAVRYPVVFLRRCDVDVRRHETQLTRSRPFHGEEHLRLLERFDVLLAESLPGAVNGARRSQVRADVLLSCALDAVQRGEPKHGRELLGAAIRARGGSLLTGKGVAAALGSWGGRPGEWAVDTLRRRSAQRRPYA